MEFYGTMYEKVWIWDFFCKWIKTIYSNQVACVKVNGYLTQHIEISRGIQQGCPLSPLIFILSTDILCRKIKQNNEIEGSTLQLYSGPKTYKLAQYADDMSLYLKNGEQVSNAIDEVTKFCLVSGLSLNLDKTEALWIGSMSLVSFPCKIKIYGIKWPPVIKYKGNI